MAERPEYDFLLRFTINGDEGVGKYSLRRRYMGSYVSEYVYGCYVGHPIYRIEQSGFDVGFPYIRKINGKLINMFVQNIFDVSKFKQTTQRLQKLYYHGTHGAFILFDRTDPSSFKNVRWWIDNLLKHLDTRKVPIMIIGNKIDLCEYASEPVSKNLIDAFLDELIKEFASQPFPVLYQDTDCKSGDRVEEAFNTLVTTSLNWIEAGN